MQAFISELEKQYLHDLQVFYSPFFSTTQNMENFIQHAFLYDLNNRNPRQMILQVQRFVTLANEINKLHPGRDGLRALFLKCCMESLGKLADMEPNEFYAAFPPHFSLEGTQYILDNFSLLYIDYDEDNIYNNTLCNLTIDDILFILKAARDMVVHEGNYWDLQLFSHDETSAWLTHIKTQKQLLTKKTYINTTNKPITYHFETTLQYNKLIREQSASGQRKKQLTIS